MMGTNQVLMRSLISYFLSAGDGDSQSPEFQPPTGGCYLRLDTGSGGSGTVVVTGEYDGSDVEETITTFDSEGVAFSAERFDVISTFDITLSDATTVTIYPANDAGDIINYSTYTSSYVRGNWKYSSKTAGNKLTVNIGGEKIESEVEFRFNNNFTLRRDDLLAIDGFWYKVELVQRASRATQIAYLSNTGDNT